MKHFLFLLLFFSSQCVDGVKRRKKSTNVLQFILRFFFLVCLSTTTKKEKKIYMLNHTFTHAHRQIFKCEKPFSHHETTINLLLQLFSCKFSFRLVTELFTKSITHILQLDKWKIEMYNVLKGKVNNKIYFCLYPFEIHCHWRLKFLFPSSLVFVCCISITMCGV